MASGHKLSQLIGPLASFWPVHAFSESKVFTIGSAEVDLWLTDLDDAVRIKDIRPGAGGGRVSVQAKIWFQPNQASRPDGLPMALATIPGVQFFIQSLPESKAVPLFMSVTDRGTDLILEGLPVEIRLPVGLVGPHPIDAADASLTSPAGHVEKKVGSFSPGSLDSLEITYRDRFETSIKVHVRVHVNEDLECAIIPAVPITFDRCRFSEIACLSVHGFTLIPNHSLAPDTHEWLRHSVAPWTDTERPGNQGLVAVRSIQIDPDYPPIKDLAQKIQGNTVREANVEFVMDDLVTPLESELLIPIPRHLTIGIRRSIEDPVNPSEVYAFDKTPVLINFNSEPILGMFIEHFYYVSQSLKSIGDNLDPGLRLSGGLILGKKHDEVRDMLTAEDYEHALLFEVAENLTLRTGYARNYGIDGSPEMIGDTAHFLYRYFMHHKIVGFNLDIMKVNVGFSFGRYFKEEAGFGGSFEFTGDIFVSRSDSDKSTTFRAEGLQGQKVAFLVEGLGWRQGSFNIDGVKTPDGVRLMFGPVGMALYEVALAAEEGASYLVMSTGLVVKIPKGFEGKFILKRLRIKLTGDEDAPKLKLDGIFVWLKCGTTRLEVGGYYTQSTVNNDRVKEFGLTGTLSVELPKGGIRYLFALDLLRGTVVHPDNSSFDYFMFQALFRGSIPIWTLELRGARALLADNMLPKLKPVDKEVAQMRYFNWYRSSNPLTVPGHRRLDAWKPHEHAWALGVGLNLSVAGMGKIVEMGAFVLVVSSSSESGFMLVLEAFLLGSFKPVGYGVLEIDSKNDRWGVMIGAEFTFANFIESVPGWIGDIIKFSGNLFICNKPSTVAVGRLLDERTWLAFQFDFDLWIKTYVRFAMCFEYVDAPSGVKGFGLVVRLEGGINALSVLKLTYHAGFGFVIKTFSTASKDYALVAFIEAGVKAIVLGFLRFGISASIDYTNVGKDPSYGEFTAKFRFETPWFLPDVKWQLQITHGSLEILQLETAVTPLRLASASHPLTKETYAIHVERFDRHWDGSHRDGSQSRTFSVAALQGGGTSQATRIQAFETNPEVRPIPIDATIAVEFSVPVKSHASVANHGHTTDFGSQEAEDLKMSYALKGITVLRRRRFGLDRSWKEAMAVQELNVDFSDTSGVALEGQYDTPILNMMWNEDIMVENQVAAKRLLINSSTQFDFNTANPETDETILQSNPNYPCCNPYLGKNLYKAFHRVHFREELPGIPIIEPRLFSTSTGRLLTTTSAYVRRVTSFGQLIPQNTLIAFFSRTTPGVLFRAELDREMAFCSVRFGWRAREEASVRLISYHLDGSVDNETVLALSPNVGQKVISVGQKVISLSALGAVRRFEFHVMQAGHGLEIEIDEVMFLGLEELADVLREEEACEALSDYMSRAYEGKGKVAFLPNHDYEIGVKTEICLSHEDGEAGAAEVEEFVYFSTKGLPGLNAQERPGLEVEPFIMSEYSGGRSYLYRQEPITLQFSEDFYVAVPLDKRSVRSAEEHTTLMEMQLIIEPGLASSPGAFMSATDVDWIVAHRIVVMAVPAQVWEPQLADSGVSAVSAVSADPTKARLAEMTMRPFTPCPLSDPAEVVSSVLIAHPQGTMDPHDATKSLWPENSDVNVVVRARKAPFVHREQFVVGDQTAFSFAQDNALEHVPLRVNDRGEMFITGDNRRRYAIFGEADWNHVRIRTTVKVDGLQAGVGVALDGSPPSIGLFAVVERLGEQRYLKIYKRDTDDSFSELDSKSVPKAENDSYTIAVTAFDDRLRTEVGEVRCEADRGNFRDGCLCLFATGSAVYANLYVRGLDIYRFSAQISRYRSFADHIGSFKGAIDRIAADDLGPGASSATVAALWQQTRNEVISLMLPQADSALREELFARWVCELGMPYQDEVTELRISRYEVAGKTEAFLIESPDPIDFTEETTFSLAKMVLKQITVDVEVSVDAIRRTLAELNRAITIAELVEHLERLPEFPPEPLPSDVEADVHDQIERLLGTRLGRQMAGPAGKRGFRARRTPPPPPPRRPAPATLGSQAPGKDRAVRVGDVVREGKQLHLELLEKLPDGEDLHNLVAIETMTTDDGKLGYRLYNLEPVVVDGRASRLEAQDAGTLSGSERSPSALIPEFVAELAAGTLLILNTDLTKLVDLVPMRWEEVLVATAVFQNGDGHRVIVIPLDGSSAKAVSGGLYRMKFELERQRFSTTEPPSDLSRYTSSRTLSVSF